MLKKENSPRIISVGNGLSSWKVVIRQNDDTEGSLFPTTCSFLSSFIPIHCFHPFPPLQKLSEWKLPGPSEEVNYIFCYHFLVTYLLLITSVFLKLQQSSESLKEFSKHMLMGSTPFTHPLSVRWGPRISISNKHLGDAYAPGPLRTELKM